MKTAEDQPKWDRGLRRIDATTLLTVYLVLLLVIPAGLVVSPLGGAGSPAQLLGLLAALWWGVQGVIKPKPTARIRQPVRIAMLVLVTTVLVSYVLANLRPINAVELRAADRGLLILFSWLGIMFLAMDGIRSRARLDVLLNRLALGGGLLATLGIVQFFSGQLLVDQIVIPGLSPSNSIVDLMGANGFNRPAGTALHPIEFGVVLTMILPIALHYALDRQLNGRLRRWFPVVAIAVALPLSISRSAILGATVVLLMLFPTWSRTRRLNATLVLGALGVLVFVTVPGLLGTLASLFTGIASDSSALSRTGSYDLAIEFISRAPIFGRGFGTFLPGYRILDNQYLGIAIELGIVGLVIVITLFLSGFRTAWGVRQRASDQVTRQLAQSIAAMIAAGALSLALFDAFSFPMVAGLLFLSLGLAAALNRLEALGREPASAQVLEVAEGRTTV